MAFMRSSDDIDVSTNTPDVCLQFEASLKRELETAQKGRADFISEFSEKDYEAIVGGWQDKLGRVAEGLQKWGLFTAVKPTA